MLITREQARAGFRLMNFIQSGQDTMPYDKYLDKKEELTKTLEDELGVYRRMPLNKRVERVNKFIQELFRQSLEQWEEKKNG